MSRRYAAWPLSSRYSLMFFHPRSFVSLPSLYHSIYSPSRRENSSNGTPVQSLPSKKSHLSAPTNPSARVVGVPGPPRHRAHHPGAARLAPLAPHVDGAAVGVHRERPSLRRADYPHQVPEHADHQVRVGVDRGPPADRPAVEAVDRRRQVRAVPVESELCDVGDHEQAGRGGVEVVRPAPAKGNVGRAPRELTPVAAVPRPPAHLRRLAGDQALLAHDPTHDLLGRDDGSLGVPGRERAPRDGLAGGLATPIWTIPGGTAPPPWTRSETCSPASSRS